MILKITRKKLKLKRKVKHIIYILMCITVLIILYYIVNNITNNNYNKCIKNNSDISFICEDLKD